ncbi:MAG: hypothetical protein AB7I68_14565 [Porticoccaceae bacterium]
MSTLSPPVITSHPNAPQTASRAERLQSLPHAPDLAHALQAIRQANLPQRRAQELIAALNTVARVLGRPLAEIPADPALLRRRLAEAAPMAHGVSLRRWANVRSLLAAALRLVLPVSPSRQRIPLPPAWQPLHNALLQVMPDKRRRAGLTRFMQFCAQRGLAPDQVDQAAFDAYRDWLAAGLRKDPEEAHAAVCRAWNKVADHLPDWRAFQVERPSRQQTWTLPWEAFPATLKADVRHSWLDRLAGLDPSDDAAFSPVRPATLRMREYQLRAAASALVHRGRAPETIHRLADLASLESFKEILRYLRVSAG